MKKLLLLFTSLFVLNACSNQEQNDSEGITSPTEDIEENTKNQAITDGDGNVQISTELDFRRYFKPADSTATFIGDGNEFASYTEKTTWLSEKYVATIINNGGAVMMKIYRVDKNRIDLIMNEIIDEISEEAIFPGIETLDGLPTIETYLAGPIEVGTSFGDWTIVETNIELATPYQTFEQVFVLEEVGEDFKNKKYIVLDYGIIKTEAIMTTDSSEEYVVTSTLENISLH